MRRFLKALGWFLLISWMLFTILLVYPTEHTRYEFEEQRLPGSMVTLIEPHVYTERVWGSSAIELFYLITTGSIWDGILIIPIAYIGLPVLAIWLIKRRGHRGLARVGENVENNNLKE